MGGVTSGFSGGTNTTVGHLRSPAIARMVSEERISPSSDFWHLDLTAVYITTEQLKSDALQELLDPEDALKFIKNNVKTHNLNSLLHVIALELSKLPRDFDVPFPWLVNLIFLGRIFLSHFVSHLGPDQFRVQLQFSSSEHGEGDFCFVGCLICGFDQIKSTTELVLVLSIVQSRQRLQNLGKISQRRC
jgi:hypothetical protein